VKLIIARPLSVAPELRRGGLGGVGGNCVAFPG
jgi:hypothetical protein